MMSMLLSRSLDLVWTVLCSDKLAIDNANEIKTSLSNELLIFKKILTEHNYSDRFIKNLIYCLCAALDEKIMSKFHRYRDSWTKDSLAMWSGGDINSGEGFFAIYDQLDDQDSEDCLLKEGCQLLIHLGFKGSQQNAVVDHLISSTEFNKTKFEQNEGESYLRKYFVVLCVWLLFILILFFVFDSLIIHSHYELLKRIEILTS